jgi:hypothetical protein
MELELWLVVALGWYRQTMDHIPSWSKTFFFHTKLSHYITFSPIQFVGLANQGKDIVFRFIIDYSSLRDFGPRSRSSFVWGFLKDDILACVET